MAEDENGEPAGPIAPFAVESEPWQDWSQGSRIGVAIAALPPDRQAVDDRAGEADGAAS